MSIFYVNKMLLEGLLQKTWVNVNAIAGFTNPQDMPGSLPIDITNSGTFLEGKELPIRFKIGKTVKRVDFELPPNSFRNNPRHLETIGILPIPEHICLEICR